MANVTANGSRGFKRIRPQTDAVTDLVDPLIMTTEFVTTQLLGCQPLARPDGRVALRLHTDRLGPVAFEVDRERVAILRKALSEIEQFLDGTEGRA